MACERNHQAGGRLGKIDSPRTLPTCEGGYKPFKIGELFDAANGNTDIQKNHIDGVGEYVISSGTTNNGIIGKSSVDAKIFNANTITVDMFGNVYFHPYCYKMVTHARVFSLSAKNFYLNETLGLYFVSTLSYLKNLFSYNNMCSWEKVKDLSIYLPTTAAGDIDFAFIEERVHELEEERVRELETYLKAAGFEDCTLSAAEREVLSNLSGGNSHTKQIRIDELFNIATGRDIIIGITREGRIPLISHQHDNNGISKRIGQMGNRRLFNYETTISLADRGVFLATTQAENFHIGTRVKALTFKNGRQSENVRLYFVAAINRLQILFTEYLTNATDNLPNLEISVPIDDHGAIDYAFMETAIRAMEKQCIARLKAAFAHEHEAYMQVIS